VAGRLRLVLVGKRDDQIMTVEPEV
jgi:hypothetical protein